MLLHIPHMLNADELARAQALLADAPWADGRISAGSQSALAKNNQQLPLACAASQALQALVLAALDRSALFFSATLPRRIFPPQFNRYSGAHNAFGPHIDNAVRLLPGSTGERLRTDISATLFLADPAAYDGGELVIDSAGGQQAVKLPAGDLVLYSATQVHQVRPVTRGQRLACFFWLQSLVRSDEQRQLLFNMDQHLMRLRQQLGESDPSAIGLTGTYHNLLRLWTEL